MAKLKTTTGKKTKRQHASWAQALEILEELKEKYKLSYCGPATPEVAEKVVEENKGYVLMKYNTFEYYEQDLTKDFGAVKVGRRTSRGDVTLYYGLSEDFTARQYVLFGREFTARLNELSRVQYEICECDFPYQFAIFPEDSAYIRPKIDDDDANTKKFENQDNGFVLNGQWPKEP